MLNNRFLRLILAFAPMPSVTYAMADCPTLPTDHLLSFADDPEAFGAVRKQRPEYVSVAWPKVNWASLALTVMQS